MHAVYAFDKLKINKTWDVIVILHINWKRAVFNLSRHILQGCLRGGGEQKHYYTIEPNKNTTKRKKNSVIVNKMRNITDSILLVAFFNCFSKVSIVVFYSKFTGICSPGSNE